MGHMPDTPHLEPPALMTPAQFGQQIGASRATVYRYISEGLVKPTYMPNAKVSAKTGKRGTRTRISREELDRFLRATRGEVA